MFQDCRHIRCNKILALAVAENQGRILLSGHDQLRKIGTQDTQSVAALQAAQRLTDSTDKIAGALIIVAYQIGHHLRVRLRMEAKSLLLQIDTQLGFVLNDAVMHHSDLAAVGQMGMAVGIRRCAMGCPTGVADAHNTGYGCAVFCLITKYLQPAFGLGYLHFFIAMYADTGRVISPVFQLGQTLQQNGRRLPITCISNNSTHRITS